MTAVVSMFSTTREQKHTHFIPEGNPAPPRPRRPEALISEIICIQCQPIALLGPSNCSTYPIMTLQDNFLRLVPISVFLRTGQIRSMVAIQVLKDTILIL